jgi:Icc-related predicted phosphoesterase
MKIGLVSDLHSDTGSAMPDIPQDIDILIAAGDMGNPYKIQKKLDRLDVPYAYIAGNHEFYHLNFNQVMKDVFNNQKSCYNNFTLEFMGKRIHLCTLWTEMKTSRDMSLYVNGLNDSRMIDGWFPSMYRDEFSKSLKFLNKNLKEGDIVVTHHTPSSSTVNSKYENNPYNHCFFSDLDNLILDKKPSLWLCGHMHDPYDGYVGDTRIVINPRGYKREYIKREQYKVKVIEIK